jgi:hypothetical protein
MGFLAFCKGMKIEESSPSELVLRTSKGGVAFGLCLLLAGFGTIFQVVIGNAFFRSFRILSVFSLGIALLFLAGGIFFLFTGRTVRINLRRAHLDVHETCLFHSQQASFGFQEFEQLELCTVEECLISTHCRFWTIKGYVRRDGRLRCIRLFESTDQHLAEDAARFISEIFARELIRSTSKPATRTMAPLSL